MAEERKGFLREAVELFGFRIGRPEREQALPSFVPPSQDDGAIAINEGGAFGTTVDLDNRIKSETALITKYREMALQPEAEKAIDDIVNEAIIIDDNKMPIDLNLDEIEELSDDIKELIRDEFEHCLKLLKMNTKGYDVFRNWYVDGKIFYHIVIDLKSPRLGIKELRFIDPRKIKKIKKPVRSRKTVEQTASTLGKEVLNKKFEEFYLYQSKGSNDSNSGIKIAPDAIAYCHSGVMDTRNYNILGHLHKAIKPLNQLRMLEDATVIYRLARAPERRIFYIDVGNLPKQKAEQYLRDMMVKHKNKLVYDANTGEVRDDRKFLTMLEDYWLPRREGGRGTEITTLPGGQNLGELDDVQYFRRKLYESLNVPVSRLEQETQFNVGRASEITRDEIKFSKFVTRLRSKFSELFMVLLEKQLLLKGIMTFGEWNELKDQIKFDYQEDNHFSELRDAEVLRERLTLLQEIDQYTGKYFSTDWIKSNVLKQTDEEKEDINKQIEAEAETEEPADEEE
tara:strand:- start:4146 stop:5678 length:1533 start_codon:yes stop_codon:yes gene_type:complete